MLTPQGSLDIGSRLELFVDDYLIESMDGVRLKLHEPVSAGKVLVFNKPWEGVTCDYILVFKDDDRYRMYYRGSSQFGCSNCPTVKVVPHGCKSVFCSSCGKVRTDQWCDELLSDLLDVPYRHLVFTLPWELRLLTQDNRRVLLNVLFRAAADAVLSLTG